MELTKPERLILANQFRILAKVDPAESTYYNEMITVLERGYEYEYRSLVNNFSEVEPGVCEEVVEILDMHRQLHYGYEALTDKSGINADDARFRGFDGNEEGGHYHYASFCIEDRGEWQESKNAGDGLNSHMPTLDRYRRMLADWKASTDPRNLTRQDIVRIVSM